MAWVPINSDAIINSLTSQEQSMMTDPSSASDMATIIYNVTNLVRGKVMGWQPNQAYMGPVGTIPDELMAPAVAICRYKFLTHLPGTTLITKWREAENTEAYALLADVAIGKFVILAPNGSVPNNPADTGGEPYFPPYPVWQGRPVWGGYW